jgi:hypothetical protein
MSRRSGPHPYPRDWLEIAANLPDEPTLSLGTMVAP